MPVFAVFAESVMIHVSAVDASDLTPVHFTPGSQAECLDIKEELSGKSGLDSL